LVDLMGDRRSELAHGREPGHSGELRLGASESALRLLALGEVADRPDELDGIGGLAADRMADPVDVPYRAVRPEDAELGIEALPPSHRHLDGRLERRPILRMDDLPEGLQRRSGFAGHITEDAEVLG